MRAYVACLLLALSSPAWAESQPSPPILLWGFHSRCKPLTDDARDVQQYLETTVTKPDAHTYVLAPDPKYLSCQGAECAALVQRSCPNAKGRVLGGIVDRQAGGALIRARLWMHDLQTAQTAYHDNYCQNCTVTGMLKLNAGELAQSPNFTGPPKRTPIYCEPEASAGGSPSRSNKVYWVVYGKEHNKAAIAAAVRKEVQQTGSEVPLEHEAKEYTVPLLKRLIAKDPGAQVLGVEILANGKVELFLYDGPTDLMEVQREDCDGCDKDSLVDKVQKATMTILSHCFGESCGRVGRARAPVEACRPFEVPRCDGDEPIPLVSITSDTGAAPPAPTGPEISPRLAKLTKGTLWGLFAAGTATTIALLAANYSGGGRVQAGQGTVFDTLVPAAGATAGISLLALSVAIPATIIVDRAAAQQKKPNSKVSESGMLGVPSLQCPN